MRLSDKRFRSTLLPAAIITGLTTVYACSDSSPTQLELDNAQPAFDVGTQPKQDQPPFQTERLADFEYMEVCKDYSGGTSRPDVTIEVSVVGHESNPSPFTETLGDGECKNVWLHGGDGLDQVTVTENPVPDGYTVSYVKTVAGTEDTGGSGTNGASGLVGGISGSLSGVLVVFTNTIIPTDFFGCTPGFWKNNKKAKDWTSPLDPDALFTAAGFTSPGARARVAKKKQDLNVVTQIQALNANQGDLAALTRHAMAALLNASSPGVDYEFSAADIVLWYNQAVAGTYAGTIEGLKNMFAAANEQGCPLDNTGKRD
jgi:hypothetical protein